MYFQFPNYFKQRILIVRLTLSIQVKWRETYSVQNQNPNYYKFEFIYDTLISLDEREIIFSYLKKKSKNKFEFI